MGPPPHDLIFLKQSITKDASCLPIGSGLDTSKKYRLIFGIIPPTNHDGLEKPKSGYAKFDGNDIFWAGPFESNLYVRLCFRVA